MAQQMRRVVLLSPKRNVQVMLPWGLWTHAEYYTVDRNLLEFLAACASSATREAPAVL